MMISIAMYVLVIIYIELYLSQDEIGIGVAHDYDRHGESCDVRSIYSSNNGPWDQRYMQR